MQTNSKTHPHARNERKMNRPGFDGDAERLIIKSAEECCIEVIPSKDREGPLRVSAWSRSGSRQAYALA